MFCSLVDSWLCSWWRRSHEPNGIEHRMRKEEMEEQFNKEAKQGWRFAADAAARITDEDASSEDRRHTSGGVFVAIDSILGAVVGKVEGAVKSIPGKAGRYAFCLSVCFWYSEG